MPPSFKLSVDERKTILKLRKNGASIASIAKQIHRGKPLISTFLKTPECANLVQISKVPVKSSSVKKIAKPVSKKNEKSEDSNLTMEHRAVIKFLYKLGNQSKGIYAKMKKVYSPLSYEAVKFWVQEFRGGRETILRNATVTKTAIAKKIKKEGAKPKKKAEIKKEVVKKKVKKEVSKVKKVATPKNVKSKSKTPVKKTNSNAKKSKPPQPKKSVAKNVKGEKKLLKFKLTRG